MVAAIFCLGCMDVMVKTLSVQFDVFYLVWIRYVGQAVLAVLLVFPGLRRAMRTRDMRLQFLRAIFMLAGTITFFGGLATIELATAAAILQLNPLFIAFSAYLILNESLGRRKLCCIVAGFIGALVIIRPGFSAFSPFALLPIAAAMCFTGYAIVTRYLSARESIWTSFLYTSLLGAAMSSAFVPIVWTRPQLADIPLLLGLAAFGAMGQYLMIRALFQAPVTVLAPFGYTSLVFSAAFGMILFSEVPDVWTIIGASAIVASGMFVWQLETRAVRG